MQKKKLMSGIQPSGEIHLGNYLGAIKNWVALIDKYDSVFSIVDYHAITISYEPAQMQKRIYDAVVVNIAAGLDPEKCTIFVQSSVPEHTELCWILGTITPMGLLERMTQFKDKSSQHPENINTGLFTYPVLQAADILIHKAELVPVGEDQLQHLELARDLTRKFNNAFGQTFPEPQAYVTKSARVMGIDAVNKMSKSMNNYIGLVESPESSWKKLAVAVTDLARQRKTDPGTPEKCNLYSWHQFFSSEDEVREVAQNCRNAGWGCIDCKKVLHKNIVNETAPIRERYLKIKDDKNYIKGVLEEGTKRVGNTARATMDEVRSKCGLR